jgi:DNA-binding response OmpR family regulator
MTERAHEILLVEPDPTCVEILVRSLSARFNAHITCAPDAESCLDADLLEPHELIITELKVGQSDGLELIKKLMSLGLRPVILLADEITCEQTIAALRLGVRDVFRKPFAVELLLDAAEAALRTHHLQRQRAVKYRRMRELVRRVIHERRHLNRRVELVCRDLVGAHRRLVDRVLTFQQARSGT